MIKIIAVQKIIVQVNIYNFVRGFICQTLYITVYRVNIADIEW